MLNPAIVLERPLRLKAWHFFLLLLVCEMTLSWIYQTRIMTYETYQALYSDRLEVQRIADIFQMIKRLNAWGIGMIPLITWVRLAFVVLLLQMPLVFRFIDIPFREIFRIVTQASFFFIMMELVKLSYLLNLPASSMSLSALTFTPLSLVHLFSRADFSTAALTFLSHFNLFEIAFLFFIYQGLLRTKKLKKFDAALVVFILWTIIIVMHWIVVLYLERFKS